LLIGNNKKNCPTTSGTKQTGRDERKILIPGKKVTLILIICNKLTSLFVEQQKLTC
jgi:hypothetical protein